MQLYRLLAFLYGAVEVAFSRLAVVLVAHGIERNHLGEVVLVVVFLLKRTVDVCKRTIIISVVPRLESVPAACLGGVFLRGAAGCGQQYGYNHHWDNMSCLK